jgi:Conserved TM helix
MEKFWDDLKHSITADLIGKISHFVPRFAMALIMLMIGYFVANMVAKVISKVLSKIGIDTLGKKLNDVDFMQENNVEVKISTIISKAAYYLLMMIFLIASTDLLGVPVISNFVGSMLNYFPKLMSALAIVLIGIFVADMISKVVRTTCDRSACPRAN